MALWKILAGRALVRRHTDMHRVQHSVVMRESNSNFGFNLPWWDRLFGTYGDQPAAGHKDMRLGVEPLLTDRARGLGGVLVLPFKGGDKIAAEGINHVRASDRNSI